MWDQINTISDTVNQ